MVYLPIALLIPFERHQQLQQQFSLSFPSNRCALPCRCYCCECVVFFAFDFAIVYFVFVFICPPEKNYICQNVHFLMCMYLWLLVCVRARCNTEKWVSAFIELALVWFLFPVVSAADTHTDARTIHIFIVIFVRLNFVDCHWGRSSFLEESNYNISTVVTHNIYYVHLFQSVKFGWLRVAINSKCRRYTTYCT